MKEDMEDTVEILYHVKRLQNDGFLIFVLQYNFRALLTRTLAQIEAIPSHIVDQFFQQISSYEKGEGDHLIIVTLRAQRSYDNLTVLPCLNA